MSVQNAYRKSENTRTHQFRQKHLFKDAFTLSKTQRTKNQIS